TGAILWQQRTNSGITGVPVSYAVDGRQYVAVLSGWGVDAQRKQDYLNKAWDSDVRGPQGGVLWVFGLPGEGGIGADDSPRKECVPGFRPGLRGWRPPDRPADRVSAAGARRC